MKDIEPIVSIVVITENTVAAMNTKIQELLADDFKAWHCIILDNGSDDGTGICARKWVDADARIRYVYQQQQSIAIARQNAKDLCLCDEIRFFTLK